MNTCRTDSKTGSKPSPRTGILAQIAVMTAVMCVLGPVTIPVGIIPVSLIPLVIFLAVYILGTKKGTAALIVYLLIGLAGVPVFSGFSGGPGKLFGPTGGYLYGYVLMALISGFFIHRFYKKIPVQFIGMVLGLAACYLLGTLWLAFSAGMTLQAAFAAGVLPFIAFDLCKIVLNIVIGRVVRGRLLKAGLIRPSE